MFWASRSGRWIPCVVSLGTQGPVGAFPVLFRWERKVRSVHSLRYLVRNGGDLCWCLVAVTAAGAAARY
jgi:hypothetical protein